MTERVLVTGGCGFIGANLVPQLLADAKSVRVLDDLRTGRTEYLDEYDVEVIKGDVCDQSVVAVTDPAGNFAANAFGTFTVLNAVRAAGIDRMVFSSTGGALIGDATPPVNEQSLPKPISPYGASKLAAEAYCHAFAKSYGIRTVSTRFANVYGPFSGHKKGAITVFFKSVHRGEPIVIYGDGNASRDFMYVDDICSGIRLGLTADVPGGTVVHLATGVETSVSRLARVCCEVAGRPDHPIEFRPRRPGEVERNFATYDLANELLGFEPSVALEDGLARTWKWYLDNGVLD
jgi:UDP-glucose 4-epimerase